MTHPDYDAGWLAAQEARREAEQAALDDPECDGCAAVAPLTCDDRHGFYFCKRCLPREVTA